MAASARVEVQTEVDGGKVRVRAIAPNGRINDARPVAGFFIRRRYHGEEFLIASWDQFYPSWMEFVDQPPEEWKSKIQKAKDARDHSLEQIKAHDQIMRERMQQTVSMGELLHQPGSQMDTATGQVRKNARA